MSQKKPQNKKVTDKVIARRERDYARKTAWKNAFLAALTECGSPATAARCASVARCNAYREKREDPEFAAQWEDAMEAFAESLESEATRRARDGVDKPVIYKGEIMGGWFDPKSNTRVPEGTPGAIFRPLTVKEYSDLLLIFMLKGAKPEKYRERSEQQINHTGAVEVEEVIVTERTPSTSRAGS